MEKYRFSEEKQTLLEGLKIPFAVFQFVDGRPVTIVLSDGFCEMFGYSDKSDAYYDMDHGMFKYVHDDDVARISDAAFHFTTEGGDYEAVYRTKARGSGEYMVVHAFGKHVYTQTGERLAEIWYTKEGTCDADGTGYELNIALNNALLKESESRENHYDRLTRLPSMSYFFELASSGKRETVKKGGVPAVMFMDLCGMRFYNQKYG
ncbi:MAG: PAS domain-containing protein, partial [Clostridia bacterium]|nr:PAS domain-containing protein [Clostridia bacterium]